MKQCVKRIAAVISNAIFSLYRLLPCSPLLIIVYFFQNILRSFATLSLRIVYLVIFVRFQINMVKYSSVIVH